MGLERSVGDHTQRRMLRSRMLEVRRELQAGERERQHRPDTHAASLNRLTRTPRPQTENDRDHSRTENGSGCGAGERAERCGPPAIREQQRAAERVPGRQCPMRKNSEAYDGRYPEEMIAATVRD